MDRLTPVEIERMRAEHVVEVVPANTYQGQSMPELRYCKSPSCGACYDWPCDAALLLAEVDRRDSAITLRGDIGRGLCGPSVSEDLHHAC